MTAQPNPGLPKPGSLSPLAVVLLTPTETAKRLQGAWQRRANPVCLALLHLAQNPGGHLPDEHKPATEIRRPSGVSACAPHSAY